MIDDEIYYYPLVQSPFGKVPLVGATMTDEREKELAEKYPILREHDCQNILKKEFTPVLFMPVSQRKKRQGRYSY